MNQLNDLWFKAMSDDTDGVALTVDSMQRKWRDSFTSAPSVLWDVTTSGGVTATVIWRGHLPANAPMSEIVFENPLRTTANTALNFACLTTAAAVYVNAQGFTAT